MIRSILIIACLGISLANAQQPAKPKDAEAEEAARAVQLRETIRQWIKTETLISAEAADWESERERMRQLLVLHRAEIDQLDELIVQAGESARSSDEERREMAAEIERMHEARKGFIASLDALKPRAAALVKRLPAPLRESLAGSIDQLEALSPQEAPREFTQALVTLITGAAEFNAAISAEVEVREVDGKNLELRVLYLGLARAFFVSLDGSSAGIGVPGPEGWTWKSQPELAPAITKALDVVGRKGRPDFVKLPLQVSQ